jgi:predicted kinase
VHSRQKEDEVAERLGDVTIAKPSFEEGCSKEGFAPFLLLLVGLPGAGKSTFAKEMVALMPDKYVRVNQDELKTRQKCENLARRTIDEGKCPVVDRCNFDAKQREKFIKIAVESKIGVECVVFQVSADECVRRCRSRNDHPTVHSSEAKAVVKEIARHYAPPSPNNKEGIRRVHVVSNQASRERALCEYVKTR